MANMCNVSSLNQTIQDTTIIPDNFKHPLLGFIFFSIGFCGISSNLLVLAGIKSNSNMRNTFYIFSANLIIADITCLMGAAMYTGASVSVGWNLGEYVERFFAFCVDLGWFSKTCFIVLVAMSRFLALKTATTENPTIDNKSKLMVIAVWLVFLAVTCYHVISPKRVLYMSFAGPNWQYNFDLPWAIMFMTYGLYHNITCSALVFLLNCACLVCMRIRLRQISIEETGGTSNKAKEIRLFLHCLGTSCYFLMDTSILFYVIHVPSPYYIILMSQFSWLSSHIDTSVMYLVMNRELRATIAEKIMI